MQTSTTPGPQTPHGPRATRWRWRMRALLVMCALGLLSPLLARALPGTADRSLWLLDLTSHWQWLFVAGVLVGLGFAFFVERRWLSAALLLPLPFWTAAPALPSSDAAADGASTATLTLASANVQVSSASAAPLLRWLAEASPDVVVLLEVSPALAHELASLKAYPHRVVEPDDSPFGIALLSRWPLAASRVARDADGIPRIEAELALDAKRHVKLTALHPMPPLSPHFHAARDRALRDLARRDNALDMPSVLAGDLNATPWSTAFSGLDALGWRRATGLRPTWPAAGRGLFGIPIDHVLASRHWRVEDALTGPDIGSDHRPVLVRLVLAGGAPR